MEIAVLLDCIALGPVTQSRKVLGLQDYVSVSIVDLSINSVMKKGVVCRKY